MSDTSFSTQPMTSELKKLLLAKEVLDYASEGKLVPFVENILNGNLEITQTDEKGFMAIHLVAWQGNQELLLKLLDKAACPIDIESSNGKTALIIASACGHLSIIKCLINKGANIHHRDHSGITPFLTAVQNGKIQAAYTLIHRGADTQATDKNGCTAVHLAAQKNQVDTLRILSKLGLNLKAKDATGSTALHKAASTNSYKSANFLLFCGLDPLEQDLNGKTPADVAQDNRAVGVRRLILEYSKDGGPLGTFFTYFFVLFWGGVYWNYYLFVLEHTSERLLLSLAFNISFLWLFPLFLLCKFTDCEVIELGDEIDGSNNKLSEKDLEEAEFPTQLCYSCDIRRPARSKHCRYLDKCVREYDHYCWFLGKTIAKGNRKVFFFGLLVNYLACFTFLSLCWMMLHDKVEAKGYFSTYIVKVVFEFLKLADFLKVMIFLGVVVAWYSFWYLVAVVYSISCGLTLNEVLNRTRYRYLYTPYLALDDTVKMEFRNPFNKGVLNNFIDFIID